MKFDDRRLTRDLFIAVVLKLLVLGVLWWAFVRDTGVSMDTEQTAAHLGVAAHPAGGSQ